MIKMKNPEIKQAVKIINMDISEVSFACLDKEWKYDNVCSPFTRIYMPTGGEGTLKIGDEEVRLTKGNIYIVPAMLDFSYSCKDYLEKLFFHVTVTKGDNFDLFSKVSRCLILKDKEKEIDKLLDLFGKQTLEAAFEIKMRLGTIITEAVKENNILFGRAEEYSHITKAALQFIRENLSAELSIAEIAEALFVSRLKLQTTFKDEIKMPIGKYIDECVLIEGEKELSNKDMSIKEISDKLGFCDQFYFSRKFSEKYGVSPQKYRKLKT